MKFLIFVMLTIFGFVGAWLGGILYGGDAFGLWSFLFGFLIGPLVGIWVGYKLGKMFLE